MPGYVSHTVMAREVYNRLKKNSVSLDYMLTYSLGGDLSKYAKCRKDSHRINQDKFIYNMCDYMKGNNLSNDKECMGVLYGHIMHYMMDDTIHPLVRKIDKLCVNNKYNHALIEGYYDSYLVKKIYNLRIDEYDNKKLFSGKLNKKINKMIDDTYFRTYHVKRLSLYYKFNIWIYKKIRYLYLIFGVNLLKKILGYNRFRKVNKDIDLVNINHEYSYKINSHDTNDDLISLYNLSIERALLYISEVNEYLEKDGCQ